MSYYFVAQIRVKDPDEYRKYLAGCDDVFSRYNGKYLAVDGNPLVLEGDWVYTRTVIISFPDEKDFRQWYYSADYQELLKYRLKAAHCDTLLVKGLDSH